MLTQAKFRLPHSEMSIALFEIAGNNRTLNPGVQQRKPNVAPLRRAVSDFRECCGSLLQISCPKA